MNFAGKLLTRCRNELVSLDEVIEVIEKQQQLEHDSVDPEYPVSTSIKQAFDHGVYIAIYALREHFKQEGE